MPVTDLINIVIVHKSKITLNCVLIESNLKTLVKTQAKGCFHADCKRLKIIDRSPLSVKEKKHTGNSTVKLTITDNIKKEDTGIIFCIPNTFIFARLHFARGLLLNRSHKQ